MSNLLGNAFSHFLKRNKGPQCGTEKDFKHIRIKKSLLVLYCDRLQILYDLLILMLISVDLIFTLDALISIFTLSGPTRIISRHYACINLTGDVQA